MVCSDRCPNVGLVSLMRGKLWGRLTQSGNWWCKRSWRTEEILDERGGIDTERKHDE